MKRKHLFIAIAVLLAAGGLWFARTAWRAQASPQSSTDVSFQTQDGVQTQDGSPKPGQVRNPPGRLAPPNPTRRFTDFTPEQRVEFARRGHGPGG